MIKLVLSTVDGVDTANRIADSVVNEGLAACVNIIPGITSLYKWEGKVEKSSELLLLMKTTASSLEKLMARVTELHPYRVPELIVFPVESGLPAYLQWVAESSRPH